jgi:hypothetical protein
VLGVNEKLGGGGKIVEDILFASEVASVVPLFAVLAPATKIGDNIDAALIEPETGGGACEKGALTEAVTAIAIKRCGVGAVERGVFAANNVQRDASAILGGGEGTDNLGMIKIVGRRSIESCTDRLGGGDVKAEPRGRLKIAGNAKERVTATRWRGVAIPRKPAGVEAREESVPDRRKHGYAKGRR